MSESSLEPNIIDSGAFFDRSQRYRYSLHRRFATGEGTITMIMLNPSTADAHYNDPTITRCIRFAHSNGFRELIVVNLFAFRATVPCDLKGAKNPIGKENDAFIKNAVDNAAVTLVAWGNHGHFCRRDEDVLKMLESSALHCLGRNKGGSPKHPLYVPASQKLLMYR